MKKSMNLFTSPMLYIKVLAVIGLFFATLVSCSDDGDDVLSFLDVHGNTQWKFEDPNSETVLYLRINDNEMNPFELWLTFVEDGCYIHESVEDDGRPEILENSENRIQFRVEESELEYTVVTLTVSRNVITVESEYYEDGSLEEDNIVVLFANDDNISDLDICAF